MAVGIGASGVAGLALETTPGTYVAPDKFFPFNSESLQFMQDTNWRRPIRNSASVIGAVPGNVHTEGDITMEALSDVVPYFLMASRCDVVKTGASSPFTYAFTPSPRATPENTLSLTLVRNGVVFGYTGLVVGSFTFSVENGLLNFNCRMVGSDEDTESVPTPVWPTTTPFGAGQYELEMPTGTPVEDMDGFSWSSEDNAEPQYRLRAGGVRGAKFVKFGEHSSTLTVERDFESRTAYEAFKALTAQSLTLSGTKSASDAITLELKAAITDSYTVNLSSQGDLVRASTSYQAVADATGIDYEVTIATTEDITVA
jgi:hypothetical protein